MTTETGITEKANESRLSQKNTSPLTVIVPAYNEAENIADTIRSLQNQTVRIEEIIVVDDCSTDGTGDAARACGVTVITPPSNTGTKAGAQNFALERVQTEYTMALDADTTLAPDAIELLLKAFDQTNVAAACGFVVPRHIKSLWERGRYVEYLFAFTFYKPIQDYYEKPLISSGCFSVYKTDVLKANNGWSTRTMAEDMDLTWSFYQAGHSVRFVPEALCYPIEPHNFTFMRKQLKRWSHGFIQNVQLHWRGVLEIQYLRTLVGLAMWDATIASLAFLVLIPLLSIFVSPFFLLGYVIDAPAVLVPVLFKAQRRKEFWRALASFPAFLVLRMVNAVFFLEAFWTEIFMRQPLRVYEKGH
ncbi:MAG TPA: glycosyltransferase [Pyrinomonadaceae bacterium]|jgi:biofilm PGA synthesis N-glycosyltransferase PgaC